MEVTAEKLNELLDLNSKLREDVEAYVDEYVEWVSKNVPSGLERAFGVGIVSENRFGTYWGFETDDIDIWGDNIYAQTGNDWYVGGDFNCLVRGSEFEQVEEFAERIPDLFETGMEEIKNQNERLENVKLKEVKL